MVLMLWLTDVSMGKVKHWPWSADIRINSTSQFAVHVRLTTLISCHHSINITTQGEHKSDRQWNTVFSGNIRKQVLCFQTGHFNHRHTLSYISPSNTQGPIIDWRWRSFSNATFSLWAKLPLGTSGNTGNQQYLSSLCNS